MRLTGPEGFIVDTADSDNYNQKNYVNGIKWNLQDRNDEYTFYNVKMDISKELNDESIIDKNQYYSLWYDDESTIRNRVDDRQQIAKWDIYIKAVQQRTK